MLTKRESGLSKLMIAVQVVLSVTLFLIIVFFFAKDVFPLFEIIVFVCQIAIIWTYIFSKLRLGMVFRISKFGNLIRGYALVVSLGCFLMVLEIVVHPAPNQYRAVYYVLLFAIVDLLALVLFKLGLYSFMRFLRRKGYNSRNIIIIADVFSIRYVNSFIAAKDWGYEIVAIVSPDESLIGKYDKVRLVENQDALNKYISKLPIDDVFYCRLVNDKIYDLEKLILQLDEIGVSLHILQCVEKEEGEISGKYDLPYNLITHKTVSDEYFFLQMKNWFDLAFGVFVLSFFSPLLVLIAALIKIHDGGPIFFKQERIGLNGRRFHCYKFRSMVVNAEALKNELEVQNEADGPVFKIENDPRITKIGRFLRKTSLDELPQFFNVVRGDMSVVGPRPPLLKEVLQYERTQLRRLSMKPGITCTWQVYGRHKVSFSDWMQMDLDYIDNWSLKNDFKIIMATVGVVFKADGR